MDDRDPDFRRLETPSMVGYRHGMSASSMIAQRLGALYDVPAERKFEIEAALETLNAQLD